MADDNFSKLNIAALLPGMEKDYIVMYYMPVPKVSAPNLNLRYVVHLPLKRRNLPKDLIGKFFLGPTKNFWFLKFTNFFFFCKVTS